jgi:hypothetical protein
VPSKKSEANKSPATSAPPSPTRTHRKPKAAKSKAAAAAANGDSILNLADAVNGQITPEQVAERAYFRWIERGCPVGTAEEDWLRAEQELAVGH